jgi:DNA-binding MarR family transcriptional regulator
VALKSDRKELNSRSQRGGADSLDIIIDEWAEQRPDLDPSPMGILARIARIEAMKRPYLERVFIKHQISAGLFDVLAALRRAGHPYRRTPTELAATTMLTTGGMTGRLDRLEAMGLVEREAYPNDRRVSYARLSSAGLKLIDIVIAEHLENEERLLAFLSPRQRERLARDLRALERSVVEATEVDHVRTS